jgi:hypothetical protein
MNIDSILFSASRLLESVMECLLLKAFGDYLLPVQPHTPYIPADGLAAQVLVGNSRLSTDVLFNSARISTLKLTFHTFPYY